MVPRRDVRVGFKTSLFRSVRSLLAAAITLRTAKSIPLNAAIALPLAAAIALSMTAVITGCAASVPLPRDGDHAGDEPILVPSPPPVPKVEIVPQVAHPQPRAVWVSGQWLWRGRRWEWEPGTWVTPSRGDTYAPPAIVFLDDKQIAWLPGKWHHAAPK